jgi:hypothetical protein
MFVYAKFTNHRAIYSVHWLEKQKQFVVALFKFLNKNGLHSIISLLLSCVIYCLSPVLVVVFYNII